MNTSKIIKAYIGAGTYSTTEPITQGDYGYILQIEGAELPATYRVDFSNNRHEGEALTVYGNENGAEVPEELIATGKDIFAFYYYIGENFGKTAYTWKIPNDTRAKYGDRTPTPTQQDSIDQLIVRSNEAVETAERKAEEADQSAQSAKEDSDRAEQARDDASTFAQRSANSAQASADYSESAQASATASAQSASDAETARQATTSLVAEAQRYADASAQSASASANSASQAQGYAQSASASANSASGYASQADISANTASAKAQDASQSATTATQKATESAQSATNASQSAQTAEQAKADSQTAQGLAESARDSAISAKADAESAKADAESARDEAVNAVASISGALDDKADIITDTASGAVASFTDGADGLPLKSLIVNINPIQDLTNGDPSPENICPISGWTGMQIQRDGTNLFDQTLLKDQAAWNIIRFYAPVGTPLTMSTNQPVRATSGLIVFFRHPNESQTSNNNLYLNHSVTKIVRAAGYVEIVQRNADNISSFADWNYQIEILDVTPTDYEPYRGRSIPISWQTEAGTVYGGKLDVLSGVLRAEWTMVDLGTLRLSYQSNNVRFRGILPQASSASSANPTARTNCKCSIYKESAEAYSDSNRTYMVVCVNLDSVWIRDNRYTDAESFKTAMSGVQLCYELAEPQTYQLTPHEVNSLLGVNNIFADTGDTTLEYRADPDLYIQRKMPEVPVDDVQINGQSIVEDGVANVPIANDVGRLGVIKLTQGSQASGLTIDGNGNMYVAMASNSNVKGGTNIRAPIVPSNQHVSVFYGLAKSAGDTTQSQSSNAVGNYTEDAKSAISEMLGGSVAVSGTTPTIVAKSGIRYVCGEVATLDFTPSQTGICDVVFTSGSTPTVVTLPNTVKFPDGELTIEADTTYEINILDGIYGAVMAWT